MGNGKKTNNFVRIDNSRWAIYATAGAATALVSVNSAEADIHHVDVNERFDAAPGSLMQQPFSLAGSAFINFGHYRTSAGAKGAGLFFIGLSGSGGVSAKFAGTSAGNFRYVSRLSFGANIAAQPTFAANNGNNFATLAFGSGYGNDKWLDSGTAFVGFKFNIGLGVEYGWARVTTDGSPGNAFTLVDYAWGDPGDTVTAGQTTAAVPEPGSLGLLALGGLGLMALRRSRARGNNA
jgi:hypothetical protein